MSHNEAVDLKLLNFFSSSCSLQENRPLSKAFFTRMIQIEKEQVRKASTVCHMWKLLRKLLLSLNPLGFR